MSAFRVIRPCALALLLIAIARVAAAQEAPPPVESDGRALFAEPTLLTSIIDQAIRFHLTDDGDEDEGFYPKVGGMISGAGWISLGPGYRRNFFDGRARGDVHATVSWRAYLLGNATFEFPLLASGHLAAGAEALWQDSTQVNYYGLGPDTPDVRAQYRLQTTDVVMYARYRPRRWLAVGTRFGWLARPSVSSPTGPFQHADTLDAQTAFPNDPAMTLAIQPRFLHSEMAITADNRNFPDHLTHGGLYRASAGAYVADQSQFSFNRYEVEGLQAIPLLDRAWVIVLRGWGVFNQAPSTREVPVYLMPALGGANTLRGYANFRFHDSNLLLASVESRLAIFAHMDAALFVDSGTVAPRVGDLGLNNTVYGFGVRVHTHTATLARVDVAHNREGWSVLFRSSDAYNLDRLKQWVAAIPFVP